MKAELAADCRCVLGEGAVWNAADASLYFVDIKGCEVLAHTPASGALRRWAVPQMVGWLVPRAGGGWVAGFAQGVVALTLETSVRHEWLHRVHDEGSPMRLNDAKADAAGRLWFGTMNNDDERRPDGKLYRCVAGSAPEVVDAGYGVTNGPTSSTDGRTLYHTDTLRRTIYAFDVAASGELSNKRVHVTLCDDEGHPDGMCTDADGHLWVAHWGGSRVTQRDAAGRVLRRIAVDAPQVTNVAFGGADLSDLYITTARIGMDDDALARTPHAGGLFVARGAGRGRLPASFAG